MRIPDGVINEDRLLYFRRKAAAQSAPKATMETRVALIVAERGLTEKQMAKYFVRRRKNCKPRFDYWHFAKAAADRGIVYLTSMAWPTCCYRK